MTPSPSWRNRAFGTMGRGIRSELLGHKSVYRENASSPEIFVRPDNGEAPEKNPGEFSLICECLRVLRRAKPRLRACIAASNIEIYVALFYS